MTTKVFLACPLRPDGRPQIQSVWGTQKALEGAAGVEYTVGYAATSLLPYTFNMLWCMALNARKDGVTRFAMQHDDIWPEAGWMKVLLDEMDRLDADAVAAVSPIKDEKGLVSTAVCTGDQFAPRRLTMTEVYRLPDTFGSADVGGPLLLNTGLWVCRLDRDWCEKVGFRQQDQIVKQPDGTFAPRTCPEDWDFSRQLRALGADRLYATRKVPLTHEHPVYHTRRPWGACARDPLFPDAPPVPPT